MAIHSNLIHLALAAPANSADNLKRLGNTVQQKSAAYRQDPIHCCHLVRMLMLTTTVLAAEILAAEVLGSLPMGRMVTLVSKQEYLVSGLAAEA